MDPLVRQFDRIGARVRFVPPLRGFALDVRDECFEIARPPHVVARVVAAEPASRHLLLLAEGGASRDRFVCGHDERHWFVAAVPGAPATVAAALQALKPGAVRQAEGFFVPAPEACPDPWLVLRREPHVYARGRVRHPDHATIRLDGWHRVFMNTESQAPARRHVVFLD